MVRAYSSCSAEMWHHSSDRLDLCLGSQISCPYYRHTAVREQVCELYTRVPVIHLRHVIHFHRGPAYAVEFLGMIQIRF